MSGPRLEGKRVLVIGAGAQPSDDEDAPVGNGRAIAVLAAREGASVLCADRDEKAAQETAEWITREGGDAYVLVGDVASEDDCRALVESASISGAFDGLVLNVGIGRGGGLARTTAQDWTRRSPSTCVRISCCHASPCRSSPMAAPSCTSVPLLA